MPERQKTVGILTGGGDVPGLNPALKTLVSRASESNYNVVGIRRGWGGLLNYNRDDPASRENNTLSINIQAVRTVDRSGGTFLHTSRTNPGKVANKEVPEFLRGADYDSNATCKHDFTSHVLANLEHLGIDVRVGRQPAPERPVGTRAETRRDLRPVRGDGLVGLGQAAIEGPTAEQPEGTGLQLIVEAFGEPTGVLLPERGVDRAAQDHGVPLVEALDVAAGDGDRAMAAVAQDLRHHLGDHGGGAKLRRVGDEDSSCHGVPSWRWRRPGGLTTVSCRRAPTGVKGRSDRVPTVALADVCDRRHGFLGLLRTPRSRRGMDSHRRSKRCRANGRGTPGGSPR